MFTHYIILWVLCWAFYILSVNFVLNACFMNYMTWFHVLKNLSLVISNYFKLVRILYFGRVFQTCYIFKSYFWKLLPNKGGWMGDHALYTLLEYLLNSCIIREVAWVIYLILIIFSIGIPIDIFLLVNSSLVFFICMLQNFKSINFYWYLLFHTYIWFDLYFYILKHKLCLC